MFSQQIDQYMHRKWAGTWKQTYNNEHTIFVVDTSFLWDIHDGQPALEVEGMRNLPEISKESREEEGNKMAEGTQDKSAQRNQF